jgi:release factor family 2
MDTGDLQALAHGTGPFTSVYYDASSLVPLRWRAMRDQLEAQSAGEETLAALDEAILSHPAPAGGAGRALIVRDDEVVLDRYLPIPPSGYTARLSPLPYLLPLVDLAEPLVPHVIVHLDHLGADLRGVDHAGRSVAVATVGGRLPPSDDRLRTAELSDISDEAARMVTWLSAPLLVLAGPLRARRALRNTLPTAHQHIVVEVDATPRSGATNIDHVVHHLASRRNHDEHRDVVDRFRDESSRLTGTAVHGLRAVSAALSAGAVATLLLSDTVVGERDLWVDPGGSQISATPHTGLVKQRADEVLPHAAVATRADIVLVGDHLRLREDVGALLRA